MSIACASSRAAVDVVTFEFENVPAAAAEAAEAVAVVRPHGRALEVAQHRVREKRFLVSRGLPVAPYAEVRSEAGLLEAVTQVGRPIGAEDRRARVRRQRPGGDRIPTTDPLNAWESLGRSECGARSLHRSRTRDLGHRCTRR